MEKVYVLTQGEYRGHEGEYVRPEVYTDDTRAYALATLIMSNDEWAVDKEAIRLGGEHVVTAWSNEKRTRTIWLEVLPVKENL